MANIFTFKNVEGSSLRTKKLNWLVGMVADSQGPQGLTGATGPQGPAGLDGIEGTASTLQAWESEAWKLTSSSYATEAEDVFVKLYTSVGDGTFTTVNTTDYSALHWRNKANALSLSAGSSALASANSATEASNTVVEIGSSVALAQGYAEASQASADLALSNSEAINFVAGMIVQWDSDRKPVGWLWCDGASYKVWNPTPANNYSELYNLFPTNPSFPYPYTPTTKPENWDTLYPTKPNGWYDTTNPNSVVTQAELDLEVTVPDKRGVFIRGKDQAGILPARGIDTNGVVDFSTVVWSQNKEHTHILSNQTLGIRTGNGPTDDDSSAGPDNTATVTMSSEGGAEAHPTYQTTNFIIRAKGVYNGTGGGTGGSSLVPVAREIEFDDTTTKSGFHNLQDIADNLYYRDGLERVDVGQYIPPVEAITGEIYSSYNLGSQLIGKFLIVGTQTGIYKLDTDSSVSSLLLSGDYSGVVTADYVNGYVWVVGTANIARISVDISTGQVLEVLEKANGLAPPLSASPHPTDSNKIYFTSASIYMLDITTGAITNFGIAIGSGRFIIPNGRDILIVEQNSTVMGKVAFNGDIPSYEATTFTLPYSLYIKSEGKIHSSYDSDNSICTQLASSQRFFILDFNYLTESISTREEIAKPAVGNTALPHPAPVCQDARYGIRTWTVRVSSLSKVYYWDTDPENRKYAYRLQDMQEIGTGNNSTGIGKGVSMQSDNSVAFGEYNLKLINTLLEVGIGTDDVNRANGLEVYSTGDIQAPNRLAVPNPSSLLTKDIADGLYTSGVTGTFTTADGKTATVTNGLITALI